MISCILLAAGLSSRFQSPKSLAVINGTTVIEQTQQMLLKTDLYEIIIVLGHAQELIKPHLLKHNRIKVVYNKDYNFGQTSSFKAGLSSVTENVQGVFLLPVDYPFVKSQTINLLMQQTVSIKSSILIPVFQGRKGHPPYFASSLFKDFLNLKNTEGLNTISRRYSEKVELIQIPDAGILKTFNTKQELEMLIHSEFKVRSSE